MLNLASFSKQYKTKKIFNLTNFTAEKSEIVLLMGKSGIGKTTLLDIIAGIKQFDIGKYFFDEQLINVKNDSQMSTFRNKEIGYILQDFALIEDYTVLENIMLPVLYSSEREKHKKRLETKVRDLAYDFELTNSLNVKIKNVSGGQKQRTAIIRSIILNPQIILADEPTTNLDQDNFELVIRMFKKLKNEGKIIIIATHDGRFVNLANKIYTIENFKLIVTG